MRRRLPVDDSSDESECEKSDVDDSAGSDTDLTDFEICSDEDNEQDECLDDQALLFADENHPPEHWHRQLETFNETEFTKEDYADGSTSLINRIEDQWNQ